MIGVFDSGIGGLGVLLHLREQIPKADMYYIADQGRAPYGPRPLSEVAEIATAVTGDLIARGASTIVIACNTASAAALHSLRARFAGTRFVGMEPAVKPAALQTTSGVIGVVATAATFQSELFESVVRRFAGDAEVVTASCPDWVELVEAGTTSGPGVEEAVRSRLSPLIEAGADTIVLGCTHFPFLLPIIRAVVGPSVTVVDPAPAVARQAARIHVQPGDRALTVASTGSPDQVRRLGAWLQRLGLTASVLTIPI